MLIPLFLVDTSLFTLGCDTSLFTLMTFGWNTTLVIFGAMILVGLIISLFLSTPTHETLKEN